MLTYTLNHRKQKQNGVLQISLFQHKWATIISSNYNYSNTGRVEQSLIFFSGSVPSSFLNIIYNLTHKESHQKNKPQVICQGF